MQNNLVSAVINAETEEKVVNLLTQVKEELPFLISLPPDVKSKLFKPGDAYKPFIATSGNVVTNHPEIMSGTFDKEEFIKDVELFTKLQEILLLLTELQQSVDDTVTAAGTDALASSLEVYDAVKGNVSKVPGLASYAAELKAQYPSGKHKKGNNKPEQ